MSLPSNKTKKKVINLPPSLSLLAFGTSSVIKEALLYPFCTIKTRLQSSNGLWKSGGFGNPYRGLFPSSIGCISIGLLNKSFMIPPFERGLTQDTLRTYVMAVFSTRMAPMLLATPCEVLCQRRQTEATPTRQIIKDAFRNEGIYGFFRGFWTLVGTEFVFMGLIVPVSECFRAMYSRAAGRQLKSSEVVNCYYAGVAVAAFLTTPLEVAKTRIILYKIPEDSIGTLRRVPSLVSTLRSIYREEGVRRLFTGGLIRASLIVPASIVLSAVDIYTTVQLGIIYDKFNRTV